MPLWIWEFIEREVMQELTFGYWCEKVDALSQIVVRAKAESVGRRRKTKRSSPRQTCHRPPKPPRLAAILLGNNLIQKRCHC